MAVGVSTCESGSNEPDVREVGGDDVGTGGIGMEASKLLLAQPLLLLVSKKRSTTFFLVAVGRVVAVVVIETAVSWVGWPHSPFSIGDAGWYADRTGAGGMAKDGESRGEWRSCTCD